MCGQNLKELRGGSYQSCIPHVMTNIVTRQMVMDGDPNRRSCEQSEALGVDLKFDLHKRCARNHTTKRVTRNAHGEIVKQWRAKLNKSRVMQVLERPLPGARPLPRDHALIGSYAARVQVFSRGCLRESLRRDEASVTYLQRRDHSIMLTGKAAPMKRKSVNAENQTANQLPRYAAKTDVSKVVKERRAEGDFAPRTARE